MAPYAMTALQPKEKASRRWSRELLPCAGLPGDQGKLKFCAFGKIWHEPGPCHLSPA